MKKVLSIVAALMVAVFAMVSCGTVQSAADGIAAGEAYGKAFTAANGDLPTIAAAYHTAIDGGTKYASDATQYSGYLVGLIQAAEKVSADCAGSIIACTSANNVEGSADLAEIMKSGANDKAAVEAAAANFEAQLKAYAAEAAAQEEAPAEDSTAAEGEEAPAEEAAE